MVVAYALLSSRKSGRTLTSGQLSISQVGATAECLDAGSEEGAEATRTSASFSGRKRVLQISSFWIINVC